MLVFCCVWQPHKGLNFSQRQIFIHQSVQCSTGQAWEEESAFMPLVKGELSIFSPFLPTVACRGGPAPEAMGADALALRREDTLLTFLPAPLILLAKFTVSIFPGTLSSSWQPECMPSCEIEPEKQVREKSVSTQIRELLLKQKQKTKTKKQGTPGARSRLGPDAISRPARRRCRTWRRVYPPQPISGPCQGTWRATRAAQPFPCSEKATSVESFALRRMPNVPAECV